MRSYKYLQQALEEKSDSTHEAAGPMEKDPFLKSIYLLMGGQLLTPTLKIYTVHVLPQHFIRQSCKTVAMVLQLEAIQNNKSICLSYPKARRE